jgi:hypothetical protein
MGDSSSGAGRSAGHDSDWEIAARISAALLRASAGRDPSTKI